MSHISSTVCDAPNCGQVKKESNHWWRIRKTLNSRSFLADAFIQPEQATDLHICGSACLHKMLDSWIDGFMPKVVEAAVIQDEPEETMYERSARLYPDGVDHKGDAVWPFSGAR